MDELEFRRRAYAHPRDQQADFLAACDEDPARKHFVRELKSLENKLEQALKITPPEGLAEKLLLNQQLHNHRRQRAQLGSLLAIAASAVLVISMGFTMLRLAPIDLSAHALEHVHHEPQAWHSEQDFSPSQINAQLASITELGADHFTQLPGKVSFSKYCDFQGVRSLHLVMQGLGGKVTLFIVPQEKRLQLAEHFHDSQYNGITFASGHAYMVLLGDKHQDLSAIKSEIEQSFI